MATSEGIPSSIDIEFLELNDNPYIIRLFQWSNRIFCFITCPFCNVYLRLLTLPNDSSFSAFSWV